jgi:hypothetical protein
MSVVASVSTVGSRKLPPCAARLPPVTTLAPFFKASAMCDSTFSTAFMLMSGPITAPGSNPSAIFMRCRHPDLGAGRSAARRAALWTRHDRHRHRRRAAPQVGDPRCAARTANRGAIAGRPVFRHFPGSWF